MVAAAVLQPLPDEVPVDAEPILLRHRLPVEVVGLYDMMDQLIIEADATMLGNNSSQLQGGGATCRPPPGQGA